MLEMVNTWGCHLSHFLDVLLVGGVLCVHFPLLQQVPFIYFLYFHASIASFWVHHYGVIISSFIQVFFLFPYILGATLVFSI